MAQVNILTGLKQCVDSTLLELEQNRLEYVRHPTFFTRKRKLTMHDSIILTMLFTNKGTNEEIIDQVGDSSTAPSQSALIQQRRKFKPEAFRMFFQGFNRRAFRYCPTRLKGYRLIAVDGSGINISRDPNDEDTYISEKEKGYNQIHMNGAYDVLDDVYTNARFQGKKRRSGMHSSKS